MKGHAPNGDMSRNRSPSTKYLASTAPKKRGTHGGPCAHTRNISKSCVNPLPKWFTSQDLSKQADLLSVFDGPSGLSDILADKLGIISITSVDKVRKSKPINLLNNSHLTCLAKVVRLRKPKFLHGAPDCACWSKATDFSANNKYAMKNILQKRKNQENILARFGFICKTAIKNGAHIMIENPTFSKIWKQPIMLKILSIGTDPNAQSNKNGDFLI